MKNPATREEFHGPQTKEEGAEAGLYSRRCPGEAEKMGPMPKSPELRDKMEKKEMPRGFPFGGLKEAADET